MINYRNQTSSVANLPMVETQMSVEPDANHLTGEVASRRLGKRATALVGAAALTLALAAPGFAPDTANARINGLFDNNLGMISKPGLEMLKKTTIKKFRMTIEIGTPVKDQQVSTAIDEATRQHWPVLVAAHHSKNTPLPTRRKYVSWLSQLLGAYPQIKTVEATNEPELNEVPEKDAVNWYEEAVSLLGTKHVLAGGFSDQRGRANDQYVRRYVRILKKRHKLQRESPPQWALHFYDGIVTQSLERIKRRIKLVGAKRKKYDITEISSFVGLGPKEYTEAEQLEQTKLIEDVSKDARNVYWTGGESCIGCQPYRTAALAQQAPASQGAVLPFTLPPPNNIRWDGCLFKTTEAGLPEPRIGMLLLLKKPKTAPRLRDYSSARNTRNTL